MESMAAVVVYLPNSHPALLLHEKNIFDIIPMLHGHVFQEKQNSLLLGGS